VPDKEAAMATLCVVPGCAVRGQHLGDCPNPCLRHGCDRTEDACHGCRPAAADYALLCTWDRGRLARAIVSAPDLVEHIRDQVEPGAPTGDGMPGGSRTPPAPLRLDAVDAADLLYAAAADLAAAAADAQRLAGPDRPGVWRDQRGRIIGASPATIIDATRLATNWLHVHLDWVSAWPAVGDLFAAGDVAEPWPDTPWLAAEHAVPPGLVRLVEQAHRRWPTASRERHIPGVVCPTCDAAGSLVYHPPGYAEGPVTVQCARCGYLVPDDRHGWYARLLEAINEGVPASA
jgi:Zn ribbon nucleic-acid-binding protein